MNSHIKYKQGKNHDFEYEVTVQKKNIIIKEN
jgi:hypothetical protein